MILKTCIVLVLSVVWEVSGASFSNVYVQTGPEVTQGVKFLEYGVPSYPYVTPQIAQLSAAQLSSVVSLAPGYGYEAPCIPGPCLVPERSVATVASVAPTANVVAYQQSIPSVSVPNVPVVYSPKGQTSYEYTYSIYNQLHSERNNGGVVAEYALLQPDGIVREVQYVADDLKGFNAIVKNFLPVETKPTVVVAQPCPETKSEPLVVVNDAPPAENNVQATEPIVVEPASEVSAVQEEITEPAAPETIIVIEPLPDTHENIVEVLPDVESTTLVEATPVEQIEEQHDEVSGTDATIIDETIYVPYNDVLKCIQAAMSKLNGNASPGTPLSYIILNKPC